MRERGRRVAAAVEEARAVGVGRPPPTRRFSARAQDSRICARARGPRSRAPIQTRSGGQGAAPNVGGWARGLERRRGVAGRGARESSETLVARSSSPSFAPLSNKNAPQESVAGPPYVPRGSTQMGQVGKLAWCIVVRGVFALLRFALALERDRGGGKGPLLPSRATPCARALLPLCNAGGGGPYGANEKGGPDYNCAFWCQAGRGVKKNGSA